MNNKTNASDVTNSEPAAGKNPSPGDAFSTFGAAGESVRLPAEPAVDPAVAAIHAEGARQRDVHTRFDASRYARKQDT